MRIAVDVSTEVGNRSVRVLLADPGVEYVGVLNESVPKHRRSGPIDSVAGYDVLVSDGTSDIHRLIGRCTVEDVAVVVWPDVDLSPDSCSVPVVHGANVATALVAALGAHPAARIQPTDTIVKGWTEPGQPLKSGVSVPFPDPIGPQWGRERSAGNVVAFRDDEWAGAVVDVDGPDGRRIIGVSDHAAFMEAIVLAGVSIAAARGAFDRAIGSASSEPEHVLGVLDHLELELAVWSS